MQFGLELFAAFIFLYPIMALIRNYQILKSPLYLEFAFVLFLTFINFILLYNLDDVKSQLNLIFQIVINLTAMMILFIFYNIFWKSSDKELILHKQIIKILTILSLLPFQIIVILNYTDEISEKAYISRFLFQEFYRFIIGYSIYSIFKDLELINQTNRTKTVKQILLLGTLIVASMGLIRFIGFTLIIIDNEFLLDQINTGMITDLTILIGSLFVGLLLVTVSIFFPEALIITKTQLILVEKLYQNNIEFTENNFSDIPSTGLRTYLKEVSSLLKKVQFRSETKVD